jgi:hypothetical protein
MPTTTEPPSINIRELSQFASPDMDRFERDFWRHVEKTGDGGNGNKPPPNKVYGRGGGDEDSDEAKDGPQNNYYPEGYCLSLFGLAYLLLGLGLNGGTVLVLLGAIIANLPLIWRLAKAIGRSCAEAFGNNPPAES